MAKEMVPKRSVVQEIEMEWPVQKHGGVVHLIGMQISIDGTEAIE